MNRIDAALAGLLHDIGKFWQRADHKPRGPGYEAFGPEDYGKHGAHATWSAAFVERYAPPFAQDIKAAVFYHHQPQDHLGKAVALANRLASGERADETEKQPRNLLSIFCQISGVEQQLPEPAYLPLRPLALEESTIFPSARVEDSSAAYEGLWHEFQEGAAALSHLDDATSYVEGLYHLFYQYTWCVPSAFYRSTPDISLFDHSRVTAAIAACVAHLDEETIDHLLKQRNDQTVPIAYLVEGDISGVQKFIYTITSKGAAKGLRGRSFYLQLLTEAIARFVLRDMALPITNLLYVGGGHFYLLVPPDEVQRLDEIQHVLDRLLLHHHDGALYAALGCTELYSADFQAASFGQKWRQVGQEVARAKRRRFASLPEIFEPRGHGGNEEKECQVCHAERDDVHQRYPAHEDDEPVRKCDQCVSLEELGRKLGQAEYLILGEMAPQANTSVGDWQSLLSALGVSVGLLSEQEWLLHPEQYPMGRAVVLGLSDFATQDTAASLSDSLRCPVAAGIRFTANVMPRKNRDDVATFEDMQDQSHGLKRLGVLRMDVDDLGYLFGYGFNRPGDKSLSTIARVASLSSMMALFFEGWVGKLCQRVNDEAQKGLVYTIYSGGDDLFIVGAWDVLPTLAEQINQDLQRFAAHNPQLHLSAGITLHGGKYPLYQAAQDAAGALEASKDLSGKNALTFLGQTVSWQHWKTIVEYQYELCDLVESRAVGRTLLQILQQLYDSYLATQKALSEGGRNKTRSGHEQIVWGPYMWHSVYLLTRLAERSKEDARQRVIILRDHLSADNFQQIRLVGLAARWAEALTKAEKSPVEE